MDRILPQMLLPQEWPSALQIVYLQLEAWRYGFSPLLRRVAATGKRG